LLAVPPAKKASHEQAHPRPLSGRAAIFEKMFLVKKPLKKWQKNRLKTAKLGA